MKDYLVYGTRHCGFDKIFEWILDHTDSWYVVSNTKLHTKGLYENKPKDVKLRFFTFYETSLVYNEDLMFAHNTSNYTKSIVVLRYAEDFIDDILSTVKKNAEKVVERNIDLFEEYVDEYTNETNKLVDGYKLFINFNKWLWDIPYRNSIAEQLGFNNTDNETYIVTKDYVLRSRIRFRKHITNRVKQLNDRIDDFGSNTN